jgi:hypothetical protein
MRLLQRGSLPWDVWDVSIERDRGRVWARRRASHDPSRLPFGYTVTRSGRPLAELLIQLQQAFLPPINYEEVPLENDSELRSKTITTLHRTRQVRLTPGLYGVADYKIVRQGGYIKFSQCRC